jgi:hypothetical protein
MDAGRSPRWVFRHHAEDQLAHLLGSRPSSNRLPGSGNQSPIHVKAGTVPADNGFRSDDDERLLLLRPQPANRSPEEFVKQMKSWSRMASFQHNQLLP